MFGHMKDPVAGTATVVSYEAFTEPGMASNQRPGFTVTFHAQVVVVAEGVEPTAVEWITNFPQSELPLPPNAQLPVIVDRHNPRHLKLADGFAKNAKAAAVAAEHAGDQAAGAQAAALAATMRNASHQ
jgi:hypothetical protein